MKENKPVKPARPWDALIIGGGPAGLAAGLHLARAGYRTLLAERRRFGGQAASIGLLENYPGLPPASGAEAMKSWLAQARNWKLSTHIAEVLSVSRGADGVFKARLRKGSIERARTLLWCAGAGFRSLGVTGEKRFSGHGVWNTSDEAPSLSGLTALVIGGGEAAVQQAIALAGRAKKVCLVSRSKTLKAHRLLLARLAKSGVEHLPGFRVSYFFGGNRLEGAELLPAAGRGAPRRFRAGAAFILIGKEPRPAPARWRKPPPGFFLAGDAAGEIYRQVAVAGGDGIRAAMRAIEYLENR
jgi:thioredoxin reductase (NADPH)